MSVILTVAQHKGGVGKTTVVRLLAEYFVSEGFRTCVVDLDTQCNLSQRLLQMDIEPTSPDGILPPLHPDYDPAVDHDWNGRSSIADIFYGKEIFPYPTRYELLDIMPGDGQRLRSVELVREDEVKEKVHDRLNEFFSIPDVRAMYDVVLIDTSPSKGPITVSALRASTHMLIPCVMEPQSIEGLRGMLSLWRRENRARRDNPLELIGILPNQFRKRVGLHESILASLREDESMAPLMAPCVLGNRASFAETDHAEAKPKSVFDLGESSEARKEALEVAKWVREQVGL